MEVAGVAATDQRGASLKRGEKERQGLQIYFLPAQPSSIFPRARLLSLSPSPSLAPTRILAVDRDKTKGSPCVRTITFCITSGRVQLSKQYGPGVLALLPLRPPQPNCGVRAAAAAVEIRADRRCAQCALVHL